MIKCCLFDLDGTLLDTLKSIQYYVNDTVSKRGIHKISLKETKVFVGKGARVLIENILKSRGFELSMDATKKLLEEMLSEYVLKYDSNPLYLTEPYDGIRDAVTALGELGIDLAVISNKPDQTVKQLTYEFFGDAFSVVEGASERFPLKPAPEWPLDMCERLGVLPSEVMYVGDTSTDMKTAKAFGAGIAVGVLWGFRDREELAENGADAIISHPSELLTLIREVNK